MGTELRSVKPYAIEVDTLFMPDSRSSTAGVSISRCSLAFYVPMSWSIPIIPGELLIDSQTERKAESGIRLLRSGKSIDPNDLLPVLFKLSGDALIKALFSSYVTFETGSIFCYLETCH